MSPQKHNAFANRSKVVKETIKPTIAVGDEVWAKKCPFGNPYSRPAIVQEVHSDHFIVIYTSTKGSSCDGEIRKPFRRKDGTYVVLTGGRERLNFSDLK